VAVVDPEPVQLRDALREASGVRRLRLVFVPQSDLPPSEDAAEAEAAVEETNAEVARLRAMGQDTFIVRLTTEIIERAVVRIFTQTGIATIEGLGFTEDIRPAAGRPLQTPPRIARPRRAERTVPIVRSLGMRRGMVPTRVSQARSRSPVREVCRPGVRSERSAPPCPRTSSSMRARSRTPSRRASICAPSWYWRRSS
jgi:hypothetical protein